MCDILKVVDQYGDGTAKIVISEYMYQGARYIKAVRKVTRTGKASAMFQLPAEAARKLAEVLLENGDGFVDEYGDGSVYILVSCYEHQNRCYVKAERTVVSTSRSKKLLDMPDYAARRLAEGLLEVC